MALLRANALVLAAGLGLAPPAGAQLEADEHTLLLLRFDGDSSGVDGELPIELSGASFEPGVHGQGVRIDALDRVSFGALGEFDPAAGTVEFWVRPAWSGIDRQHRTFFSVGGPFAFQKDGADNLVFLYGAVQPGVYCPRISLEDWNAGEWHHLAITWEVPGWLRIYVDGFERSACSSGDRGPLDPVPPLLWIGSREGLYQGEALYDELRISGVARSPAEIARSFAEGAVVSSIDVEPITSEMYPTWRQTPRLSAQTSLGRLELPRAPCSGP